MSIVAFWNNDKEKTGTTLSAVATATRMAIERNFKVLLISTNYRDDTVRNCFFENNTQKNQGMFGVRQNNIGSENGLEGLARLIKTSKVAPTSITNYTRVILRDRLEILTGFTGSGGNSEESKLQEYRETSKTFPELIKVANMYYDMVIVDVDNHLNKEVKNEIIETANVNLLVISQKLSEINTYEELKRENPTIIGLNCIPVIGRYDRFSKYNKKNVMRYLKEKREIGVIPYNTLYFEAAEEANVVELFLRLRNVKDANDTNYFFMKETQRLIDNIIARIQELQMKMR